MKRSVRRIANALLVVGIVGISFSLTQTLFLECVSESGGCLAALSFSGGINPEDYMQTYTLAQTTSAFPVEGASWSDIIKPLSSYLILLAVLTLIVLEAFELYYIRRMIGLRKSFRFV